MELKLKSILQLTEEQAKNSKIELNMKGGSGGDEYLNIWLKHTDHEKEEGLCSECSYWGWYGEKQRNFYPGQWVFSFIRMPDNEWLMISAAEIIDVPKNDRATVRILDEFKPYFGRLVIKYYKGQKFARYVFNYDPIATEATVKEILPCLYSGRQFEGYDRVHLSYGELQSIFDGKIMPTYLEALKKINGVYCLTDWKTGKLYIGSAYGEEGVAQRWRNYLDSKHGDNRKLIDLYNQEGSEYFEKHFTFTLLEYFGLSYDPVRIIDRESYWKDCLDTRKHGYNGN